MSTISVRINKDLYEDAVIEGNANYRSAVQQLNFWIEIGKNALANPDLPVEFIRDVLIAKRQKLEPFEFEEPVND